MWWCHAPSFSGQLKLFRMKLHSPSNLPCWSLPSAAEPLLSYMQIVTEIVVPTVCTLCILIAAVLLMLLLRSLSWDAVTCFADASFREPSGSSSASFSFFSCKGSGTSLFSGFVIISFPLPLSIFWGGRAVRAYRGPQQHTSLEMHLATGNHASKG